MAPAPTLSRRRRRSIERVTRRPDQEVTPMSLAHETCVVTMYHFGVRLDAHRGVHRATSPVGLER